MATNLVPKAMVASLTAYASKAGMTLNQVKGFLDASDELNKGVLDGTGLVCVPFFYTQQYMEQLGEAKRLTDALTAQMELNHVLMSYIPEGAVEFRERKADGTDNWTKYIPGITGPRVGDEAIDGQYSDHRDLSQQ